MEGPTLLKDTKEISSQSPHKSDIYLKPKISIFLPPHPRKSTSQDAEKRGRLIAKLALLASPT